MAIKDRRRVDDPYSRQARAEGYPARSVYKLREIEAKRRFLRPGGHVLDLGCAPGSWSLYAAAQVGPAGRVVGLDLNPVAAALPPWAAMLTADLLSADKALVAADAPFDAVLSDMAPKTMGRREVDQARSLELCQKAWEWAEALLKPGGAFLFKIFQSPEADAFIRSLAPRFKAVSRHKPAATRKISTEIYALGEGFRPTAASA